MKTIFLGGGAWRRGSKKVMPITIRGYVPSQEKIGIAAEVVFTPQDEQETS